MTSTRSTLATALAVTTKVPPVPETRSSCGPASPSVQVVRAWPAVSVLACEGDAEPLLLPVVMKFTVASIRGRPFWSSTRTTIGCGSGSPGAPVWPPPLTRVICTPPSWVPVPTEVPASPVVPPVPVLAVGEPPSPPPHEATGTASRAASAKGIRRVRRMPAVRGKRGCKGGTPDPIWERWIRSGRASCAIAAPYPAADPNPSRVRAGCAVKCGRGPAGVLVS